MTQQLDFNKRMAGRNLELFARYMMQIQKKVGFKISARGWCYQLEVERIIDKNQFDKVEGWINRCRRLGLLPIDFVAEESARQFEGIEEPAELNPLEDFAEYLHYALRAGEFYNVDWWEGETYYIQMIVEKVDLVTLFRPICKRYHIPIANTKGWSSMMQRAEYAKRFQQAEERGLQCLLLYCGDLDPDGIRISDFLKKNLFDLKNVTWSDGTPGYNPRDLIVNRFGLNRDFIEEHQLTWIDNLITGNKTKQLSLADPRHRNHYQPYVQAYLAEYGERKCEANALIPHKKIARDYVEKVILGYLGQDARDRFIQKRVDVMKEVREYQEETGILEPCLEILDEQGIEHDL